MRIIRCPHCGKVIELGGVRQAGEKVAGRYLPGTKGAVIVELIKKAGAKGITRAELQRQLFERYGDDSVGRLNRVLYELRSDGKVLNKDGAYVWSGEDK